MVPLDWRRAIFKKGKKSLSRKYRPVSLTSIAGKILERLIQDHIEELLLEKNYLSNRQHGFMKDRSCHANFISFYEEVSITLDRGVAVDVVYLDFAKAFDTVPHTRLMCKVKSTGLEISVCKWIENWLKDRIQSG